MMDILFLSELNGKSCKSSNLFSMPRILIKVSDEVDLRNSYYIYLAASTNAISSGDGP
jgi:hypothetical protein